MHIYKSIGLETDPEIGRHSFRSRDSETETESQG